MNIQELKKIWNMDKKKIPHLTLTTFIYKYEDDIDSIDILKELHRYAGLKNFCSWKNKYFKLYPIKINANDRRN